MGYYKQQEIADQEKIDDIIRWWKSHEGQPVPQYLLKAIIEDDRFFRKVQFLWEGHVDAVLGQKRMTRKESERLLKEHKREAFWTMDWTESRFVTVSLFISGALNVALVAWLAMVMS